MDNYLFKNYQDKADNQLLLIEDRKSKIRKDLYMMYFIYLNRFRSEIFNYIKKGISSIDEPKTLINQSKKEILSTTLDDIKPLINERLPFLTIEQLTLTKYSFQNKPLRIQNFPEKDLDLDVKSFYRNDNKTCASNISLEYQYYDFSEEYELNSSIDLDDFNFENENLFDYGNIPNKPQNDFLDNEKIMNESLIDFDILEHDQEDYKNIQTFDEISNLLNWSEWLDFSLSYQLKKITNEINNILYLKKFIKKKISSEFLDYVSDNNFLVANPSPFVSLLDLANKEFIDFENVEPDADYSKIYFLNLNTIEIEFFDMNLNIIRNKITDLKYQLRLLIKKEKYWNNKKIYANNNKSIINKI